MSSSHLVWPPLQYFSSQIDPKTTIVDASKPRTDPWILNGGSISANLKLTRPSPLFSVIYIPKTYRITTEAGGLVGTGMEVFAVSQYITRKSDH